MDEDLYSQYLAEKQGKSTAPTATASPTTDLYSQYQREHPDPHVSARDQAVGAGEQIANAFRHPIDAIRALMHGVAESRTTGNAPILGGYKSDVTYDPMTGLPEHDVQHATADLVTKENTPNAVTLGQHMRGALTSGVNAASLVTGPTGLVGRTVLNAGLGAINDPDQPLRGALVGAGLGQVIHTGAKAVGAAGRLAREIVPKQDVAASSAVSSAPVAATELPVPTEAPTTNLYSQFRAETKPTLSAEGVTPQPQSDLYTQFENETRSTPKEGPAAQSGSQSTVTPEVPASTNEQAVVRDAIERAESPKPEPLPAGRKQDYTGIDTDRLSSLLKDEQAILEKNQSNPALAGWVRTMDNGETVSGGSLGGAIARKQSGFAQSRIADIESELRNRGVPDEDLMRLRLGDPDADLERAAIQDEGSTPWKPIDLGQAGNAYATPFSNPVGPVIRGNAQMAQQAGNWVRELPSVSRMVDAWNIAFDPAARSPEAGQTGRIVRANTGEMARDYEQASESLKQFRSAMDKAPVPDQLAFIDRMEKGEPQASPELSVAAATIRKTLDTTRDEIRNLGTGALDNFIKDYFPHIWSDPAKAQEVFGQTFGKRPLEGSKSFLQQRTIPTTAEGIAQGLEPVTTNPADLTLLKLREMQRYLMSQRIMGEMKENGLVKFVRAGQAPPDGMAQINDKIATVRGPMTDEGAMTIRGQYYAPEPVARVLNNYLAPGLRGNALYDAYRGIGNTLNQAQLGLSAFHLGFTSVDAAVSRVALGLEQLTAGKPFEAAKTIASSPAAPITNLLLGRKIRAEYLKPGSVGGDISLLANAVAEAGGRIKMDSFYRNSAPEQFSAALREGQWGKAAATSLPALLQTVAKPIMEHIVPMQKLGVFGHLAREELSKLPDGATADMRRQVLTNVWNSVDNRMGQLVYDNLFWNKTFKDLSMASVRSVGWNLGTVRELGGGISDATREAIRLAAGQPAQLTHRAAYVAALPITVGMLGAVTQYLATGKGPETLKDYFYPKTGTSDADGNDNRVQLPSYVKDLVGYAGHPFETIKHKVSPLLSMVGEMLNNEDFYGNEIRNPDDPYVQQMIQEAHYVARLIEPFSIRNEMESYQRGDKSPLARVGPWVGITPAPRNEIRSDAQNRVMEYLAQRHVTGSTPEDAEARAARAQVLSGIRGTSGVDLGDAVSSAVEHNQLTSPELNRLLKRSGSIPMQERFKSLTVPQALDVFGRADPREQALWLETLQKKIARVRK